jgi:hypothetical protein
MTTNELKVWMHNDGMKCFLCDAQILHEQDKTKNNKCYSIKKGQKQQGKAGHYSSNVGRVAASN